MENILEIFKNHPPGLSDKVMALADFVKLGRGDYFLTEGQVNDQIAIVDSGVLQVFFNKDGDEITTYLAGPGKIAVSLSSFFNGLPSKENIRAMCDVAMVVIKRDKLYKLKDEDPDFRQFYMNMLEYQISCIEDSRFDFITLSAEERYMKLLRNEISLLQQIPAKYLASTLGITERHLSRIRKKLLQAKL
ncbi:MAG: Crp/Fnr family transcriptional regulator [Bacteroidales bacterium]|nr:Crp/Fnr family transcriptional regulator [Bacteroidales bacterium]